MYTLHPEVRGTVLACVCPNHSNCSNSSTGLQYQQQQQQQCSFASVVPSPGTAAGKPCSCCCGGQDVSHSSRNSVVDTTTSENVMPFLFIIIKTKWSLHFRTDWSKEQHRVRVFYAMLVLIFVPQQSVHFRTDGYDLLEKLERNSKTK